MEAVKGPDASLDLDALFMRLVDEYQTPLKRMCCLLLKDRQLAEDAVQETYIRVYKTLDAFRGECSEKTWLSRIAVNICRDMLRSRWFKHVDSSVDISLLPEAAAPEERGENELLGSVLALPVKQREVILLYFYQDMTMQEISEALNISVSNVSRRLDRAKRALKQQLEGGDRT